MFGDPTRRFIITCAIASALGCFLFQSRREVAVHLFRTILVSWGTILTFDLGHRSEDTEVVALCANVASTMRYRWAKGHKRPCLKILVDIER